MHVQKCAPYTPCPSHTPTYLFRLMTGGSCFTAWEAMLAEAEKEAKTHVELAQKLSQSVANQLSEITTRKRVLKKKVIEF